MVVAAGRTLTADYPLRDSGVRARGELEVPLKHALQSLFADGACQPVLTEMLL